MIEEREKENLRCYNCGGKLTRWNEYPGGYEGYCEECDEWSCEEDENV